MVQLNEVYAPKDAMTDGVLYAYYVEEISAPNYSYQLAYDTQIDLAAGRETNTISMVNTRGVSIQVRVFGSVRINRDDDTPGCRRRCASHHEERRGRQTARGSA